MGAIVCEVEKWEAEEFEVRGSSYFSRGVYLKGQRCCPNCESIIYSRRHKLCGVCGKALPEDCLFSADEAHSVEALLNEERERHRKWLNRFSRSTTTPSAWILA